MYIYRQAYVRTYQDKVMDFFAAVSIEWWGAGQEHVRNYTLIIHDVENNVKSYIHVMNDVRISIKIQSYGMRGFGDWKVTKTS